MKTFKFIGVLFFVFCLFIMPVSAITYENLVEDGVGLGYYSPTTMLEIESTRGWITVFNPSGAGSLDVKIYDLPNPEDATIGSDGYIYFILRDGRTYQCIDFSYTSFVDDYNTSFVYLGDVDALTVDRTITVNKNGNVYVGTGNKVYVFTAPLLSGSDLYDFGYPVESLGIHSDGLIVGGSRKIGSNFIYYIINIYDIDTDTTTEIVNESIDAGTGAFGNSIQGVYSSSSKDVYFTKFTEYLTVKTSSLKVADYSNNWATSTITDYSPAATDMESRDIYISSEGLIYAVFTYDDTIKTYSTIDLSGGYSGGIVGDVDGSYITWDAVSYTLGDTGSYTWGWDADDKSLIRSEKVKIYKDGVLLETNTIGDTGTRYFDLNEIGTYSVLLVTTFPFTADREVASDYIQVNEVEDSFINVPQIAEQKTNFTVNYLYGTAPPTPAIFVKKLDEQLEGYVLYDIVYLDGGLSGTSYSQNMSIWGEGFYKLVLYNANVPEADLKTDVITITKIIIPPQTNINTSRIRSQEDTYSKSDIVLGDYAVDFTNYTSYVINLELYNYEYDAIVYSETIEDQSGVVLIPLYSEDLTVFTGANNIRLSSYTNTGGFVDSIVHDNITINLVGPDGYGLTLSKYEVYTDETFVIKCIVPQTSTLRIINRLTLEEIDNFEINASAYINYKISQIGDYEIRLISSVGHVRGNQYIKVVEGTAIDDPVDEDEVEEDPTQSTIDMVIMFLSMPAFWGMIIWVGVVGGVAQSNAVNKSSTGYIAFALGNILAVVGMFAPYTMYILVILWIGAGVFFKSGREAAGSEEY